FTWPEQSVPSVSTEALSTCPSARPLVISAGNTTLHFPFGTPVMPSKLAVQRVFPPHIGGRFGGLTFWGLQFRVPDTISPLLALPQNATSVSVDVLLPLLRHCVTPDVVRPASREYVISSIHMAEVATVEIVHWTGAICLSFLKSTTLIPSASAVQWIVEFHVPSQGSPNPIPLQ